MTALRDDHIGLYVSIPFCRSKCTYCNFASGVYPASEQARYVERLVEDLEKAQSWATAIGVNLPRRVDSVYLGGGTPSLLEPALIARLFGAMRAEFGFVSDAEITVECAPGQLSDSTLEALVNAGVNRVSLGVQSFIDREAQISGRLHVRANVMDDLRRLRAAGIANLNVDLIAGLAGQTLASWEESLEALIEAGVPHASVYMLEIDEDSRLGRELLAGGARYHAALVPKDDAIAQMYEMAIDRFEPAGLCQYEISNFARPGYESTHNLRYWQRRPYLGVGLDASSALYSEDDTEPYLLRSTSSDDLKAYLAASVGAEISWLSPERQHEEAWFLGLRLNRGVNLNALEQAFGARCVGPAREVVERLAESGLVSCDGPMVRLSSEGRLLSNEVFQQFLDLPPDRSKPRQEISC